MFDYLLGMSSHTIVIGLTSLMLLLVMSRALKNIQLSELFESTGTGKISHTKFWSNVAYFICTLAFAFMNFRPVPPEHLVEIWAVYLTAVAGNASISKFLSLKYPQPVEQAKPKSYSEKPGQNILDKG